MARPISVGELTTSIPAACIDVAAYLKVGKRTVYRLAAAKQIPVFKMARSWRFSRTDKLDATLGRWIKDPLQKHRNTVRFLLPRAGSTNSFMDHDLLILARAEMKAQEWSGQNPEYKKLHKEFENTLRDNLKKRFDRFAVLQRWNFADPAQCKFSIECLATGRRLVLTSDHGYAATGYFPDADGEVAAHLKQTFFSGRSKPGVGLTQSDCGPFVPPVALQITSPHGAHLLALGRRKWRSQGGYPTLTDGGLSLLEVLSPFVEISK